MFLGANSSAQRVGEPRGRLPPTTLHPSPSGSAKQCDAELVFMPQEERDNRENMTNRGFKPYGTPPPLDLGEYKDSFELWEKQWEIFLVLSAIDTGCTRTTKIQTKHLALMYIQANIAVVSPMVKTICRVGRP